MQEPTGFVLATGNADKAREICEVFATEFAVPLAAWALEVEGTIVGFVLQQPGEVFMAPPVSEVPDVEETGATLEENARIKAAAVSAATGMPAIADDTGLEVDALNGAPGVHSARYAGPNATYSDNVTKLLDALGQVPQPQRTARFATVAIARWPDGREVIARGEVLGEIATERQGTGGFGYDPVFVPVDGDGRSFAAMSADEKHAQSHRGRAFRALAAALRDA